MEGRSLLAIALLTSTEASEVLSSLRSDIRIQLHSDSAGGLIADRYVEVYSRVGRVAHLGMDQVSLHFCELEIARGGQKNAMREVEPEGLHSAVVPQLIVLVGERETVLCDSDEAVFAMVVAGLVFF